jgi:ADP-ribose pyrophosphatase YjhB (NUDIX family)
VSVKALIRDGSKILLGYEGARRYYTMPGGGIEWGESPQAALEREIEEEIGSSASWIAERPTYVLCGIVRNSRGLEWFYNLVLCYEARVDIASIGITPNYEKLAWFSKEELRTVPIFEGEQEIRAVLNLEDLTH